MVFVIVITIVLAGVMAKGVSTMKKGYELEKSLPEDSYTRAFLESQRLYFTAEGPGIQTFCGPMDYHKNLPIIDHMAKKYANSSVIMYGLVANWIPTFKTYVGLFHMFEPKNEAGFPADEDKFYVLLKKFIENPMGASFSKYIEFTDDPVPRIKWTYFPMQQIVSQDVWENEHIMEVVRKIADDTTAELNGDGKCFCYSVFHIFTEVIRYVEDEIIRNFALAGVAIFLTTFLLIVDLLTSFLVLVCVALTTVNIMGTLQYWGFYLDVNLVVLLIISIGMAVDYSAHIGYTFMTLTGTRKERASNTLRQIGPAVWHGAASTFLVFFVLIFGRSLSSFFAVFIMVVIYGLWQGIFFLPVVLALIGPSPYFNAGPEGTVTSAYLPNLELNVAASDHVQNTEDTIQTETVNSTLQNQTSRESKIMSDKVCAVEDLNAKTTIEDNQENESKEQTNGRNTPLEVIFTCMVERKEVNGYAHVANGVEKGKDNKKGANRNDSIEHVGVVETEDKCLEYETECKDNGNMITKSEAIQHANVGDCEVQLTDENGCKTNYVGDDSIQNTYL
ncbi:hypothetical protein DPMN_150668 [Dreissena polymorpha]|uniref:Uncharacterized protein n=2 Tax=Dreissena polymorpha TaxID=45954 RepID=A0A9D4FDV0_DREPO|nr:hypothetical protein DPMN_150668 [Dreissena polymorpha]